MNNSVLKQVILLLLWALTFSFQACSEENDKSIPDENNEDNYPKTEEFEEGTVTYQYNDGVMVLDQSTQSYLVKVEADTILYFSKSVPNELRPSAGGIVSSSIINDKTPYGLGNKIISVTEDNGLYKCVTTSASLDEIFKELSLSANIQLITDTISTSIEDVNGNICEVSVSEQNETRATVGSPYVLTINLGSKPNKGAYATGAISLGAVATIDIDLKQHKSECSLALYAGFDGELGVRSSKSSGYKRLLPKTGQWTIVNGKVLLGPVVLHPFIAVELGHEGSVSGDINTKVSKQFGGKFGIKNGSGFYENLTNSSTDIVENIFIDAKGEIFLVTKFDFGIGLYTENVATGIDSSIKAGFSTDFKLDNENLFINHPNLDFNITANADAFLQAKLLGIDFLQVNASLVSLNLFSHSWPLLPSLEKNSLKVAKRNDNDALTFDAEYELTGGLLNAKGIASKLLSISPAFRVYDEDEEEVCLVVNEEQEISESGKQKFSFELTGLEEDVIYVGKPCLIIGDNIYDEKGITFPSMCVDEEHPHNIDMGLPSGILWCCMNVGASCPTDFGEYYQMSYDKDIATEIMGKGYSTPTKAQFEELMAHTTQRHAVRGGIRGMVFEASNGNTIFLPAAAHLSGSSWEVNNEGSGAYWTVTLSNEEDYFYFLEFSKAEDTPWFGNRDINANKLPIRPVYKK